MKHNFVRNHYHKFRFFKYLLYLCVSIILIKEAYPTNTESKTDSILHVAITKSEQYSQEFKYDSCLMYLSHSKSYLKNTSNRLLKYEIESLIANAYLNINNLDSARYYFKKSIDYQIKNKLDAPIHLDYLSMGYIFLEEEKTDSAIYYLNIALNYEKNTKNKKSRGAILNNLGRCYMEKNQFDEALQYYFKAENYSLQHKDTTSLIQIYTNIGTLYQRTEKNEKSLEYYELGYQLSKESNNLKGLMYAYSIGIIYKNQGDFEQALKYYHQAIKPAVELNATIDLINIYNNIANVYSSQGDYKKAEIYLIKAVQMSKQGEHFRTLGIAYANIGEIKQLTQQYDSAYYYLFLSLKIFQKQELTNLSRIVYRMISDTYDAEGNYKQSLHYHKKYKSLSDSIFNERTEKQLAEIETKYQLEKKDKENTQLRMTNEVNELAINRNKLVIKILSTSLFIVIVLFSIIYWLKVQRNKNLKALVQQNIDSAKCDHLAQKLHVNKEFISSIPHPNSHDIKSNQSDKLLDKLLTFMLEEKPYLDSKINLEDLALALNSNRSYLSKTINDNLNMSFYELMNEYRLKESRLLLIDENYDHLSIEGICTLSGFASRSTFYSHFKKQFGISPTYFRKSLIKSETP